MSGSAVVDVRRAWFLRLRMVVLVLADAVSLLTLRPSAATIGALIGHLRQPYAWIDAHGADAAVAQLVEPLLWLVAAWLAIGLMAAAAAALPGPAGLLAAAVARSTLPPVLHRAVAGSLGMSLVLTPLAASAEPAAAAPAAGATASKQVPAAPTVDFDRSIVAAHLPSTPTVAVPLPSTSTQRSLPTSPRSSNHGHRQLIPHRAPSPSVPLPSAPTRTTPAPDVVVRSGDSLWAIAATRLGRSAAPGDIAAAWPAWYRTNRAVIGADPDRVYPGQHLRPPTGPAVPADSLPAPTLPEKGSS